MNIKCCDLCLRNNVVKVAGFSSGKSRRKIHHCKEHSEEARKLILNNFDFYEFENETIDIVNAMYRG